MQRTDDLIQESLHSLFSSAISPKRFELWKDQAGSGPAQVLSQYAFGEIFWKKSLGRPSTGKRSEGFIVEAWRDDMVLVGDIGGLAHWQPLHVPYQPSWWDGRDDAEYWRVAFMVPGLKTGISPDGPSAHSTYTHIVPHFKAGVAWTTDGGRYPLVPIGLRAFDPSQAVFIKGEGSVQFSFEVVLKSPSVHL